MLIKVQQEQRKDEELLRLITYLQDTEDSKQAVQVVNLGRKGYYLVDGILYFESSDVPDRRRIVVPQHLRQQVLDENHDTVFSGHFSARKLKKKVDLLYYWPGMMGDVYTKCARCVVCASVQGQGRRSRPPLKNIPVSGPFEIVGMDFKEMDLSRSGNKYALVFQEYLTKWPEVYAVKDRSAQTVAKCLIDFMCKHGVPNRIIHDRAAEFMSEVLQETARMFGLTQLPTSGAHPQTDGLVEQL